MFAWKVSNYLTPRLGAHAGPALFQLHPQMKRVEFRHPSWYANEVFERLRA